MVNWSERVREMIGARMQQPSILTPKITSLEKIIEAATMRAEAGDREAREWLCDRWIGKARQVVEIDSNGARFGIGDSPRTDAIHASDVIQ